MSRTAEGVGMLPPAVASALVKIGEDLALARVRRREPQRVWAKRLGVSVPTLIRMEKGDARVAMGVYATAVWMMGRIRALADVADPTDDRGALELDIRKAVRRRAARTSRSRAEEARKDSVR